MIRTRILLSVALVSLTLTGLCGQAKAATQTYTATLSPSITDFAALLTVPAFNPSKGLLESVSISFSDTGNFSGTVKNTSSSAQTFTVYEESDIQLVGPGVNVGSVSGKSSLSLIAQQTYPSLGTNVQANFGPITANGGANPIPISTIATMSQFVGTAPISFTMSTLTTVSINGGGGNIQTKIVTLAGATLNVIYTYTPAAVTVPEPASLVMMALGLGGVGTLGLARKRRSTQA